MATTRLARLPVVSFDGDHRFVPLVEGNTWHDQVWGDRRCPAHTGHDGFNALGRMLVMLRAEIDAGRTGQTASRPWLSGWSS